MEVISTFIDPLKTRIAIQEQLIEGLENRMKFLENNWLHWTKDTQETGQKILIALDAMKKDN